MKKQTETSRHNAVLVLILIIIIALIIVFNFINNSRSYDRAMYVDGEKATAYNSPEAKNKKEIIVSDETEISFKNGDSLRGITVRIKNENGTCIKASTDDLVQAGDLTVSEDLVFSFNANKVFAETESLIIQIDYDGSKVVGGGQITTKYYYVSVGPTSELADEAYATSTSDGNLTAEVRLNGEVPVTYSEGMDAIEHPISINDPILHIEAVPGSNTDKVNILVYKISGLQIDEKYLNATDWQSDININNYNETELVLGIELVSKDFVPNVIINYIAVTIS